jgi:NAD(P)-binding Rossmann-like domain
MYCLRYIYLQINTPGAAGSFSYFVTLHAHFMMAHLSYNRSFVLAHKIINVTSRHNSSVSISQKKNLASRMLLTDYLVIGAGAASMAFVDTLLTEQPNATVVIVDKHEHPGGHWNDGYGYLHLHQPSLLYGVSSTQLEGNWLKLVLLKGTLPWRHRASKDEILMYYRTLMNQWVSSGRVEYFPLSVYDFAHHGTDQNQVHTFRSLDGKHVQKVKVSAKLVNGIVGECKVPSRTPPAFPVADEITVLTPNQVYDRAHRTKKSWFSQGSNNQDKYVVLGAGKTAMDTVVFLQRDMGVSASNIAWVIPNDVWILRREGGTPWSWGDALLENDLNVNEAGLYLERNGAFTRVDTSVVPTKFRFPVVGESELMYLRRVTNTIRRGRVTSIDQSGLVAFTKGQPVQLTVSHIFVHCTSPGPYNGSYLSDTVPKPFPNAHEMQLLLLSAPPIPISMASLAVLESRRREGKLDLEFGRKLLACCSDNQVEISEEDMLRELITGYSVQSDDDSTAYPSHQLQPRKALAYFLAIFDKDPTVGLQWLRSNRLSFFSVPGFRGKVYERTLMMINKHKVLGISETEKKLLSIVAEKLEPLAGM